MIGLLTWLESNRGQLKYILRLLRLGVYFYSNAIQDVLRIDDITNHIKKSHFGLYDPNVICSSITSIGSRLEVSLIDIQFLIWNINLLHPGSWLLPYQTLQWRHNDRDGVSNHHPQGCLLNRLFRRRSKKHQTSASLAFVLGIHRWPLNSSHKGPVTRKMFPFDDVIMIYSIPYCHTAKLYCATDHVAWSSQTIW